MPRSQSKERPRGGPREPLTRDRIAQAALRLVDREGVDSFSMRRLADELGAGTMTLYWHFPGKREVLDAVIDAAVSERALPALSGSWREKARQLVAFSREVFERHPSVVEIWARQPVLGAASLEWVEAALGILGEAGFDEDEAVAAFRALITYTYGFELFGTPRSEPGAREQARAALEALPADRFPRLQGSAAAFTGAMGGEEVFDYGFERFLDGLEASLKAR